MYDEISRRKGNELLCVCVFVWEKERNRESTLILTLLAEVQTKKEK
jgi:hypothetical protein